MASNTIKLSATIAWASNFVGNRPLALAGGLEPALTSANTVIQAFLQPPLKYRWNRASVSFKSIDPAGWVKNTVVAVGYRIKDSNGNMQTVTTGGTTNNSAAPTWSTVAGGTTSDGSTVVWTMSIGATDYTQAISDFGFIEKAFVTTAAGVVTEIPNLTQELTQDAGSGRPHTIAPYLDDNAGNITFRLMPGLPDQAYTITVIYQKQAALLSSLNSVWPIPDRYSFVYQQGFLGMIYLFADDARSAFMLQRFAAGVLALADGLTEQERNIFLDQWNVMLSAQRAAAKVNQGVTARSV